MHHAENENLGSLEILNRIFFSRVKFDYLSDVIIQFYIHLAVKQGHMIVHTFMCPQMLPIMVQVLANSNVGNTHIHRIARASSY